MIVLVGFVWYFDEPLRTTPGFFTDEASIAYNALTISRGGVDEHGVTMPVYFRAFGEYKNPVYIYLLAGVFRVTGPSILVARTFSIVLGFFAAVALAVLVRRTTGQAGLPVLHFLFTLLAAIVTPWLFETSRLVFEVAAFPLALALALIAVAELARREEISWPLVIACAASFAAVTYTYTAGRLLGPAMTAGLVMLLPRRRIAELARVWGVYAVMMIPLIVFAIRNPGALTARLEQIGGAGGGFFSNYFAAFSPGFLFTVGDENARHHIPGAGGMIAISVAIAALIGLVAVVRSARSDPWSRYLLLLLVLSPIPGAITKAPPHALRLITLGVVLVVLAGIGMAKLVDARSDVWRYGLAPLLFVAVIVQGIAFRNRFETVGPLRIDDFNATYPRVFDAAVATHLPLGVEAKPYYPVLAWWYGALRGIDRARLPLHSSGTEPPGTVMLGTVPACATCRVIAEDRGFIAYVRE